MRGWFARRPIGGKRDFDREAREWMDRLCAPPRSAPRWWPQLRRGGRARPFGWGRLIAFVVIGAGVLALFDPSIPLLGRALFAHPGGSVRIVGQAHVLDGDTIEVHGRRIRLHGIDAPELQQECRRDAGRNATPYACGAEAKAALERIIRGNMVLCKPQGHDAYGRILAACTARSIDIGREMVRQGWAVAYTRYSLAYVLEEVEARIANRALWAGDFEKPEDWRHRRRPVAHSPSAPLDAEEPRFQDPRELG